jgi:hypothetical protein
MYAILYMSIVLSILRTVKDVKEAGRDVYPTEYTEWQRPLSDVHSIMMEKLVQAGKVGGCMPNSCHLIYHNIRNCGVRSS